MLTDATFKYSKVSCIWHRAKKLVCHLRQNGITKALRVIDRIERMLCMLDWHPRCDTSSAGTGGIADELLADLSFGW